MTIKVLNVSVETPVSVSVDTPSALIVGGSSSEGTSSSLALADHAHEMPPFGTTSGTFAEGNDSRFKDATYGLTPTAIKTSNYTASFGEMVLVDTTGGSFTVYLPSAVPGFTGSVDNRKRVAIKVVADASSSGQSLAILPSGGVNLLENGANAITSPALGQYVEYHYDSAGAGTLGEWRKVALVDFPLQQWPSIVSSNTSLLANRTYLIDQNFSSDVTLTLPIGQEGDRIGIKLQSNSNQKIVQIDPPSAGTVEFNGNLGVGGSVLSISLTRSFEYVELVYSTLGDSWMIAHRDTNALYRDAFSSGGGMSIRSADFGAKRETSYRFYTSVGGARTITLPPSGSGASLFYGDRVELIAIGHGNDRVTIDGNSNDIEFSRSQKAASATFNSNGFYMLLEWCKDNGSASFSGADCWVVLESSVGHPGSRHKVMTITSDATVEINTTVVMDVSSANVTATLPSSPAEGDRLIIKLGASIANTATIDGNGLNIDGASTITLTSAYEVARLEFDAAGGEWLLV